MIHDFNIYYRKSNTQFHLNTPTDDDNIPNIVIEELIENFGYKGQYEENT